MKNDIAKKNIEGQPITREMIEKWLQRDLESAYLLILEVLKSQIIRDTIATVMWESHKEALHKREIEESIKEQNIQANDGI